MLGIFVDDRSKASLRSCTSSTGHYLTSRVEGKASTKVFEALLTARIRVSKTGTEFVTVRLCIPHEGQDPLLDLEDGRATGLGSGESTCILDGAVDVR